MNGRLLLTLQPQPGTALYVNICAVMGPFVY